MRNQANLRHLRMKRDVYIYARKTGDNKWCNDILSELEGENYHELIQLLQNEDYQAATVWIENNY